MTRKNHHDITRESSKPWQYTGLVTATPCTLPGGRAEKTREIQHDRSTRCPCTEKRTQKAPKAVRPGLLGVFLKLRIGLSQIL